MTKLHGTSVLIADDESHIRMLFRTIAMTMGARVVEEAQNGETTVEMFKAHPPDILLLDINMPIKNGVAALEDIMAFSPDAFVIMLTTVADREIVEQCLSLGASSYILKDTPIDQIKQMIEDAWSENQK